MSPTISGYKKKFAYRYYRCRSRAFGRPPCEDVGISAFEIEEFVRETLTSATISQEFVSVWSGLDKRQQVKALKNVLKEVRFDPKGESISLTLHADAVHRLRRYGT